MKPVSKRIAHPPPSRAARHGRQSGMRPRPRTQPRTSGSGRLLNRVALITGGDSGIGRAVAVAYAREGADVAIVYRQHHEDAEETSLLVQAEGRRCVAIAGDIAKESFCRRAVERTVRELGRLDVLINNAAEQHPQEDFANITAAQLRRTFETNMFSMFYMTKAALEHIGKGGAIVNTASVTAYRGSAHLVDYSATKGAIVAFTRSLSQMLAKDGIRVNAVAPGPIWTPLITSTFAPKEVQKFGTDVPMGRPGQPEEVAPSFVFLGCDDASYITGQVIHPNGGEIVNT